MNELEQMTLLCERLGAEDGQARTMAAQLLKRADQLVVERGIERTAAVQYLVQLVISGRNGQPPPEFPGASRA